LEALKDMADLEITLMIKILAILVILEIMANLVTLEIIKFKFQVAKMEINMLSVLKKVLKQKQLMEKL
jgi:hypothetical protein